MSTPDPTPPLHTLTYGQSALGVRSMAMDPSGPRVYVQYDELVFDPTLVLQSVHPTVFLYVAAPMAMFIAWRVWAILRRPRRAGVRYCRRCNYELTGLASAQGGPASTCPECGAELAGRAVRIGRSTRARMLPLAAPAVLLLLVVAVCGMSVLNATGWIPRTPSPRLGRLVESLGVTIPTSALTVSSEVIEVDLHLGRRLRTVHREPSGQLHDISVTPRGGGLVVADYSGVVRVLDVATGVERARVNLRVLNGLIGGAGIGSRESVCVVGYAPDGASCYVMDPVVWNRSPTSNVWRWDWTSGATTLAAVVKNTEIPPGVVSVGDAIVAFPNTKFLPGALEVHRPGGVAPVRLRSWWESNGTPAADHAGTALYFTDGTGAVSRVQVPTMETTRIELPPGPSRGAVHALDPADRFLAIAYAEPAGVIDVIDLSTGARASILSVPAGLHPSDVRFSSDGRFVAAVCDIPGGTAPRSVVVWPFSPPARPDARSGDP